MSARQPAFGCVRSYTVVPAARVDLKCEETQDWIWLSTALAGLPP
jgi:hypothetical protein